MQRHPFGDPTTTSQMRFKPSSPELFLVLVTAAAALAARASGS
jgi:hypothetical protein